MTDLIDPKLLFSPEIRAAFPPTARRMILYPIINYINMLSSNSTDMSQVQAQINDIKNRLDTIETSLKITPADPLVDLPASAAVSISLSNLANIGLLSSNENEDRKMINKILALLRLHGWIKP